MSSTSRRYSNSTIKLLFGLCGNECAHPDCSNPIIELGTHRSDAAIVGQISHIYAASDAGPRGNPDLTDLERNSPDNLILLCGHHHPIVDRQFESYPATLLKSWKREHEAKVARRSATHTRFAKNSPTAVPFEVLAARELELIGVAALVKTVREQVEIATGATIISIEGLGGLGKTALASRVLSDSMYRGTLDGVAWYSIRNAEDSSQRLPRTGNLREEIIGNIASQLSLSDVIRSASRDRTVEFLRSLSCGKFVIVIDNIEIGSEYGEIAELISQAAFSRPTKFILTSRVSLPIASYGGSCIPMTELSTQDSVALMRAHARSRALTRISEAPDEVLRRLFDVVGGNPQALRLCIGLSQYYPVDRVIGLLAAGKGAHADELYRWIYLESWKLLSQAGRQLLITMRHIPLGGADWMRLSGASGLTEVHLGSAIKELSDSCLLQVHGTAEDPRYSVHRLTATFVQNILEGWMADPALARWVAVDREVVKRNVAYTLGRLEELSGRRDG